MSLIRRIVLSSLIAAGLAGLAAAQQPVVVMQSADASTLDPTMNRETSTFNAVINVFDALIHKEADGSYTPALATDWRAESDTVWTFDLREDVTFHDGTSFGPEDVVFTIQRILDEETESPIAGGFDFIESVEATGDHGVRITTTAPTPLAEHYLSELMIVPSDTFQEMGEDAFAEAPVGTGPFEVENWRRDVELRMRAFEHYWRGAPDIEELVFRPVPEATTRFASLSAGEADLINQVPPNLAESVASTRNASLEAVDGARVIYVGINTVSANPALQDPRVRRALNLAVDVGGIIEGIFGGRATPTTAMLTELDFGFNPELEPYGHDPEAARELLAEAGASDLPLTLEAPNGRYVNDVQVAQAVAEQLQQAGVDVTLDVREYGAYVGDLFSGAAPDLYLIGWGNAPQDADFVYYSLLYTDELLSYFSDETLDRALDRGRSTVDREARLEAYRTATERIHELAPVIELYKPQDLYGVSDRLDWTPRTDERIWLYAAELD
ncbi:MAG: ABC transporter substrate-binding protein [Trueperaceae bacterium]|nr:ABC transporter substrate-binding protein [Trueperaceae bacterium]